MTWVKDVAFPEFRSKIRCKKKKSQVKATNTTFTQETRLVFETEHYKSFTGAKHVIFVPKLNRTSLFLGFFFFG